MPPVDSMEHHALGHLEVGFDIPARPGMKESEIQTPCLILDLDALENNIRKMGAFIKAHGMRHRLHAKMHKSVDIALLQMELGGACGICCQKVSEAEVFARAGFTDLLISNQVRDPHKIDRLASLPKLGARTIVCLDALDNVAELSAAAYSHETEIECLIEIDCGAGRCGVSEPQQVLELAHAIKGAQGLRFTGLQAYQGSMQHLPDYEQRKAKIDAAVAMVRQCLALLQREEFECDIVGGGGTGSYYFESASGVYNELQCGSYAFMDADYGRILDENGRRIDEGEWQNALFLLTSVMSHVKADRAIVDAGLKVQSVDSGLPVVFGRDDVTYLECSDEHGTIADPAGVLKINERLRLVPGHCDPTCNIHDWYVGVRQGIVECLWPVSARGKAF